ATTPEAGIADLASLQLLREGVVSRVELDDRVVQFRVGAAPRNLDPVRGIGYLKIIDCRAAEQFRQLDGRLVSGLVPVALNRRIRVIAPESQRTRIRLAPVILRVAAHQTPGAA